MTFNKGLFTFNVKRNRKAETHEGPPVYEMIGTHRDSDLTWRETYTREDDTPRSWWSACLPGYFTTKGDIENALVRKAVTQFITLEQWGG